MDTPTPDNAASATPVAWVERTEGGLTRMWSGDLSAWAGRPANPEPLYSAATVADLRAEVASSNLQGELAALEQFLRMASEPVGQECCGQGRYECCGNPIPVFAQPNEVFQAMSDRHAEILASLATLTGADPT